LAASPAYDGLHGELLECSARVIAAAGDSDLVFVGRSATSVHDLLRGALRLTSWWARLHLLPLSLPGRGAAKGLSETHTRSLRNHLRLHGLHPRRILSARPLALVDLCCSGSTFENLALVLGQWSASLGIESDEWARKVRYVCVVHRWFREFVADWRPGMRPSLVAEVVVPGRLWNYLADRQEKPAPSYDLDRWGEPVLGSEPTDEQVRARRLSRDLYDFGASKRGRRRLLAHMERQRSPSAVCGALIRELRRHCRASSRRARWPAQRAYRSLAERGRSPTGLRYSAAPTRAPNARFNASAP